MAKGQKRGNREVKKPKAAVKKPAAGTMNDKYKFPGTAAPAKAPGK